MAVASISPTPMSPPATPDVEAVANVLVVFAEIASGPEMVAPELSPIEPRMVGDAVALACGTATAIKPPLEASAVAVAAFEAWELMLRELPLATTPSR